MRTVYKLAQPGRLDLTREIWEASAVLAGLRLSSNNGTRTARRNRGAAKNRLNDIQGSLGELAGLLVGERLGGVAVSASLFDPNGAIQGESDLVITDEEGEMPLETKCHLLAPEKKLFLINRTAHERSLDRGARGYLPILSELGSPLALVGKVIPVADVNEWTEPKKFRDPALGISVDAFCERYIGIRLSEARKELRAHTAVAQLAGDLDEIFDAASMLPIADPRLAALRHAQSSAVIAVLSGLAP